MRPTAAIAEKMRETLFFSNRRLRRLLRIIFCGNLQRIHKYPGMVTPVCGIILEIFPVKGDPSC